VESSPISMPHQKFVFHSGRHPGFLGNSSADVAGGPDQHASGVTANPGLLGSGGNLEQVTPSRCLRCKSRERATKRPLMRNPNDCIGAHCGLSVSLEAFIG
jgi:hypothetical protein